MTTSQLHHRVGRDPTIRQQPQVTKKEVVRAAFYALTEGHDGSPEHIPNLHSFAITERARRRRAGEGQQTAQGKEGSEGCVYGLGRPPTAS